MIPGVSTGGGGFQWSGGTQASDAGGSNDGGGSHVFNFGPPVQTGPAGINFNQLAMLGVAALVVLVALKK